MTVYGKDDVTSLTGYGNCQRLYPLDEPNEALFDGKWYTIEPKINLHPFEAKTVSTTIRVTCRLRLPSDCKTPWRASRRS